MMKKIEKVGIIAMPRISVGGGFARVTRDLIANLNLMGKKVYLLHPFKVDLEKISRLYGPIEIEKIYGCGKGKEFFCRFDEIGRKLMKKQFLEMVKGVDFIIDMEGGVFHNYLPANFDKNNYVIWKISCIDPKTSDIQKVKNPKVLIKKLTRKIVFRKKDMPLNIKIYPVDEWTKREIINFWKINPQELCLYPEIKVDEFNPNKKKKKQMVILGRIAINKSIDESLKIFSLGTKKHPEYKLIILGGSTPDTPTYLEILNKIINDEELEKRVEIIQDPSFEKIKEVLSESEVIIDSQKNVSLTMTAIEAMASGCIVLSQKNAGTYKEVLEEGKFGYGFNDVEEGGKKLAEIVGNIKTEQKDKNKAIERARFFSPEKFRERLMLILNGKQ